MVSVQRVVVCRVDGFGCCDVRSDSRISFLAVLAAGSAGAASDQCGWVGGRADGQMEKEIVKLSSSKMFYQYIKKEGLRVPHYLRRMEAAPDPAD